MKEENLKELQKIDVKKEKPNYWSIVVLILSVLIITTIFQWIGTDNIKEFIEDSRHLGPLLFILMHTFSIVAAPLEGSVLMIASSQLFGFWQAVLYVIIAGILGSSINFWLARIFGNRLLKTFLSKKRQIQIAKYSKKIDDNIFVLIPLMFTGLFDILGYTAGFSEIKYSKFLIAVLISSISVPFYVLAGNFAFGFNWQTLSIAGMLILSIIFGFIFYKRAFTDKKEKKTKGNTGNI